MDADGSLNFDEFKQVWTGFAAVHTQINMDRYDANFNGMLDGEEIMKWGADGEFHGIQKRPSKKNKIINLHS